MLTWLILVSLIFSTSSVKILNTKLIISINDDFIVINFRLVDIIVISQHKDYVPVVNVWNSYSSITQHDDA